MRRDGATFQCQMTVTLIKDERGKVVGKIGTAQDISGRIQAETMRQAYTLRLEQSNRDLQEFAYVASHDLQEPLRKILAFGDRLATRYSEVLDETGVDYLNRMNGAAKRMQALLNDLLAYSRLNTRSPSFEPVDLKSIAREVVSNLELRLEEVHGRIEINELPPLEADPTQIYQLLQNLFSNAIKFCRPEHTLLVEVSGMTIGETCEIQVKDNGIGFDTQYLDRIFKPFQRLHTRSEYEGTGIGLAICRRIVERHHGDIDAESVPGQGATFIVHLPARQPKGEAR